MTKTRGNGEVEFRIFRPAARMVSLVGDFNCWDQSSLPTRRRNDGWWTRTLRLKPGVYQFKYLADDEWYLDYAAFGLEQGSLDAWNSVLLVMPAEAERPLQVREARVVERNAVPNFATTGHSVRMRGSKQQVGRSCSPQEV